MFSYPGYYAEDVETHESIEHVTGENARISLSVPAGFKGTIRIYYKEPLLWRMFELVSLASVIGVGIYI